MKLHISSPLRHLKIRHKLLLIVLVGAVPTAVLLTAVIQQQQSDADSARRERDGVEYVLTTKKVVQDVQKYWGISNALLTGDGTFNDLAAQKKSDVNNDLIALATVDRKYGKAFNTRNRVAQIRDKWDALASVDPNGSTFAATEQATKAINTDVYALMYDVGTVSGLLNDPQASSAHAAIAMVSLLPQVTDALGQARAYGIATKTFADTRGSGITFGTSRDNIVGLIGQLNSAGSAANREIDAVIAANKANTTTLLTARQSADHFRSAYIASIQNGVLSGKPLEVSQFYDEATGAIDANFSLSDSIAGLLERQLDNRVALTSNTRDRWIAGTLLGFAVTLLLIVLVTSSIVRPIARLAAVTDAISLGDLDAQIDVSSKDEIGALAQSISRMQTSLQAAIERLRNRRRSA